MSSWMQSFQIMAPGFEPGLGTGWDKSSPLLPQHVLKNIEIPLECSSWPSCYVSLHYLIRNYLELPGAVLVVDFYVNSTMGIVCLVSILLNFLSYVLQSSLGFFLVSFLCETEKTMRFVMGIFRIYVS